MVNFNIKNIKILNFCKPEFNYAYPTFSKDGLTMILSSDESGVFNLYKYSRFHTLDDWKLNRSLDEINSIDFDIFPQLINDSLLVFSSYGKEQTSYFNLYSSKLNDNGKWEEPIYLENLNSDHDDYGITYLDSNSGYLCSKRNGQPDIFYFEKEN